MLFKNLNYFTEEVSAFLKNCEVLSFFRKTFNCFSQDHLIPFVTNFSIFLKFIYKYVID